VIGDGRPHLAALIQIEPPQLSTDQNVCAAVAAAIDMVNERLGSREQIEAHAIVTDAWLPGAELTETLKMRRPHIVERYAETIDALYA
jgi:long-chain acyl-CoA synthetase